MSSWTPHLPPRTRKDDRIRWKVLGSANTTRYWRAAPRSDGHNLDIVQSNTKVWTKMLRILLWWFFFGRGRKKCLKMTKIGPLQKEGKNIMIWWNLGSGKVNILVPLGHLSFSCFLKFEKICLLVSRAGKLTNRHQGSSHTAIGQVGWLDEVNQWWSPTTLPKKRWGASQWNSCGLSEVE